MTLEISHWFPSEIIREILLKLPVESLLRCKSVCKDWFSLISDHHFIKSHYTLSSTNINHAHHRLLYKGFFYEKNNLNSFPLNTVLSDKSVNNALELENPLQQTRSLGFRIIGSCNGLMCLFQHADDYDLVFLYNPSTRICNRLPFYKRNDRHECYSFGYVESADDYKIFEMSIIDEVNIYSLKTGKWKKLGDFPCGYISNGCCGIFLNGALHWVAYGASSETRRMVSLDLAKETYGEVLQPEYDGKKGYKTLTLGVLGEWFCVLCNIHARHVVDVWVMKVYGVKDSWTKLVSFPYLTRPFFTRMYSVPLFISNDGKVLIQCGPDLVIYNSKDSSSPQIEYISKKTENFEACIVVESLVSPFPPLSLTDNNEN